MAFDLTPTAAQQDLGRRTHEFAEEVVRPVALDHDRRQEFPWSVLEEAAERGFYSPLFYRDLIGDPTGISLPIFMEELFWGCAGIGLSIVMPALALSAIGQAATPERMMKWAPECFGTPGDLKLAALAISEPEGGGDVRTCALTRGVTVTTGSSTATRCGSATAASPTCTWSTPWSTRNSATAARDCSWCLVGRPGSNSCESSTSWAAAHPTPPSCCSRTSAFRPPICLADKRSSNTDSPKPANWLPAESVPVRRRWEPSNRPARWWPPRPSGSLAPHWSMRRGTRPSWEAFGGPIIDNQGIAFPLADLATQIDAARLLTWRASWMAANGVPFERGEGSMSKLAASEVAVKATERAIQTMGGWGYITDHPVAKWYRDAKLYTIFEGTSEIQRTVISNALGAAVGTPPLHVVIEPTGGPLNRIFGRGSPLRSRAADAALSMQDRVPEPVMRLAMKVLRPPGR